MNEREIAMYVEAGDIARMLMGTEKQWGSKPRICANDDPMAWWCLTELLVGFAAKHGRTACRKTN